MVYLLYKLGIEMTRVFELKKHLKRGQVYRRSDFEQWSNAVDRHLSMLVKEGVLQKLGAGIYYYPEESVFGFLPPNDADLVKTFLKEDDFLLTSFNDYNKLGVGTTQLHNKRVVYNHKRHGEFTLGGKSFTFIAKHRFPKKATTEFLLVDLVNNIEKLAEDSEFVLKNVAQKVMSMDLKKVKRTALTFGSVRTKAFFTQLIQNRVSQHVH